MLPVAPPVFTARPLSTISFHHVQIFRAVGVLMVDAVARPSRPLPWSTYVPPDFALRNSNTYGSTRNAIPCFAAPLCTILRESAITSARVAGGCFGSRPAFSKAVVLYQSTMLEMVHGIPCNTLSYE